MAWMASFPIREMTLCYDEFPERGLLLKGELTGEQKSDECRVMR